MKSQLLLFNLNMRQDFTALLILRNSASWTSLERRFDKAQSIHVGQQSQLTAFRPLLHSTGWCCLMVCSLLEVPVALEIRHCTAQFQTWLLMIVLLVPQLLSLSAWRWSVAGVGKNFINNSCRSKLRFLLYEKSYDGKTAIASPK